VTTWWNAIEGEH